MREPLRPPRPGSQQLGQAFGKNGAGAAAIGAEKLADAELQHDMEVRPREVGDGPGIVTMDALGGKLAHRTMDERLRRGETQRQLGDGLVLVPRLEVQWGASGEQTRHKVHTPLLVSKSGSVCILP